MVTLLRVFELDSDWAFSLVSGGPDFKGLYYRAAIFFFIQFLLWSDSQLH